jgi:hypothetical protein
MISPPPAIPYHKQKDPQTCGAACLSMVYESFGKKLPQEDIWPRIAKPNRFGGVSSPAHLIAVDALGQGLSAVVMQARHPTHVLHICRDAGIRVILNHRLQPGSAAGHFTVLVDIDDNCVTLHDPFFGASQRVAQADLLRLWLPASPQSEVLGNVLIAIAAEPGPPLTCEFCHTMIPPRLACPQCKQAVGLRPAAPLGCLREGCISRMWNYICCPSCDYVWTFSEAPASADEPAAAAGSEAQAGPALPELEKAFAMLDKFRDHVMSIPEVANHPDLKAQFDFIERSKEPIRIAQTEELAAMKLRVDKMAAMQEEARKTEEARAKKKAEMSAPVRLDPKALGEALLKNLGLK